MFLDDYFLGGAALFGGFMSWYIGEMDGLLKILIALAITDQASGILKGYILHKWSSDIGFHGIAKKILMFMLIGITNIIDKELLGGTDLLRDAVCCFYLANEGLSIIENGIAIGVPIPDNLKQRFLTWSGELDTPSKTEDTESNGTSSEHSD